MSGNAEQPEAEAPAWEELTRRALMVESVVRETFVPPDDEGPPDKPGAAWLPCDEGTYLYLLPGHYVVGPPDDLVEAEACWVKEKPRGWLPRKVLDLVGYHEFFVRIDPPSEDKRRPLGLSWEKAPDPLQGLMVQEVEKDSLAQDWNERCLETCPRDQLLPGDLITWASGYFGSGENRAEAMEMVLKESMGDGANSLRLRVLRAGGLIASVLVGALPWGFRLEPWDLEPAGKVPPPPAGRGGPAQEPAALDSQSAGSSSSPSPGLSAGGARGPPPVGPPPAADPWAHAGSDPWANGFDPWAGASGGKAPPPKGLGKGGWAGARQPPGAKAATAARGKAPYPGVPEASPPARSKAAPPAPPVKASSLLGAPGGQADPFFSGADPWAAAGGDPWAAAAGGGPAAPAGSDPWAGAAGAAPAGSDPWAAGADPWAAAAGKGGSQGGGKGDGKGGPFGSKAKAKGAPKAKAVGKAKAMQSQQLRNWHTAPTPEEPEEAPYPSGAPNAQPKSAGRGRAMAEPSWKQATGLAEAPPGFGGDFESQQEELVDAWDGIGEIPQPGEGAGDQSGDLLGAADPWSSGSTDPWLLGASLTQKDVVQTKAPPPRGAGRGSALVQPSWKGSTGLATGAEAPEIKPAEVMVDPWAGIESAAGGDSDEEGGIPVAAMQ